MTILLRTGGQVVGQLSQPNSSKLAGSIEPPGFGKTLRGLYRAIAHKLGEMITNISFQNKGPPHGEPWLGDVDPTKTEINTPFAVYKVTQP